jgi:1-acyl-sn-glycerol-3-phosphate acyltransferase
LLSSIRSAWLWLTGLLFFVLFFPFIFLILIFASRETTYKIGTLFYFTVLIKIMGIKLIVRGQENIDRNKSYIIMANHQSLFDVFVIPCSIPKPFVGVEASYHFDYPFWGWIIKKWGNIPINRENRDKAIKSIQKAEEVLKDGLSIGILPEGHRTITGQTGAFKKGGFHLAKNTGADILPLGISKSLYDFKNKGSWKITPKKVIVNIGAPITYNMYKDLSVDKLKGKVKEQIVSLAEKGYSVR